MEHFNLKINRLPCEFNGYKIVHISDVHLSGKVSNIRDIINLVQEQSPDIILTTGDIIDNFTDIEASGLERLYEGLTNISPVYAVTGNHELRGGSISFWRDALGRMGAHAIDNQYEIIGNGRQKLAIMGLSANTPYSMGVYKDTHKIEGLPKILLAHRPEYWRACLSDAHPPDLTFCGHAHGGQVRIPLLGGLFAPGQGLFPKYTSGLYTARDSAMIVSRGIVSFLFPMRINNRPHLPVVTLKCADGFLQV